VDFQHPIVQSVAVPLALSLALTGALGLGRGRGPAVASAAAGAALLAAALLIGGAPPWPPAAGLHKLPWLLALGLGLGVALDLGGADRRTALGAGIALLLLGVAWLAWPQLERLGARAWWLLPAAGAGIAVLAAMASAPRRSASAPAVLAVAGLALAAVAFNAGSLKLFQLGIALAAAVGGYALWNWPKPRFDFGAAGLLAVALAWTALALLTGLLTDVRPPALVALLLVFAAGPLARRIPLGRIDRGLGEPVLAALLAALPAAAAVLLGDAPAATPSADDPYYH
jgi:hypothetical protein